ncbi:Translocatorhomolog-like protein [Cladobotryum mycophilum]|uniref:Translocatorhomolog-like protein n=1 Tax=Cladobotryum mycophilum TaxID=491253 RepID=A0ABR0SFF4_9HYPO
MTTYMPAITIPSTIFQNPASSILLPVALGTIVGFSTRPSKAQKTYLDIRQPPLRPPPWLFGPSYGICCLPSVKRRSLPLASPATVQTTKHSLTLYSIQLGLNLAWMPLFFVAKRPIEATVDIVSLLGLNGYITYLWSSVDEVAGWCQAPYLTWLSFATYLCIGAGYLNDWNLENKEITRDVKK